MKIFIVGSLCFTAGLALGVAGRQPEPRAPQTAKTVTPAAAAPTSIGNARVLYGEHGPKNCRALIKESVEGYLRKEFTADDTMFSLDRNCGEFGYTWDEGEPTTRTQCLAVLRRWRKDDGVLATLCNARAD